MGGKSLAEIGDELKLSRETLKSQLRSLFNKTDTRRQGELIAMASQFGFIGSQLRKTFRRTRTRDDSERSSL